MTKDTRTVAAFMRGLNVGGHRVKMDEIKRVVSKLGFADPRTLLASGNVVFDVPAAELGTAEDRLETGLRAALGYAVDTFVRTGEEITAVASDPFADRPLREGDRIHVLFLKRAAPSGTLTRMTELVPPGDELSTGSREVFWLRRGPLMEAELSEPAKVAGTGIGPVTMRTMSTVRRLYDKFFFA